MKSIFCFFISLILFLAISCKKEEKLLALTISSDGVSMFNNGIRNHYFKTLDSAAF